MVQLRTLVQPRRQAHAVRIHHHVMPARCDVGDAGLERLATSRFHHANLAHAIEPLGKRLGESRGHVLRDDDGRRLGGHAREQRFDGLRTASRRADGDDAVAASRMIELDRRGGNRGLIDTTGPDLRETPDEKEAA